MKVVIPVAGVGKRLRPHTYSLPKPLLHVAGKPILAHLLDPVVKLNPDEVIFVIGHLGELIEEYVRDNYSFKSTFVTQDKLLGLGYAINVAIRDLPPSELMIVLGDTVVDCDLQGFVKAGDNVLGLMQVPDPQRFGIAVTENNKVVDLEEKPANPKTNLAIIGLYYFKDSSTIGGILNSHVESGKTTAGEIQFTDALQEMIKKGESFVPFEVKDWFDCGKKETMLSTNLHLLSRMEQPAPIEGSLIKPPVYIHPSAKIEDSIIGPNVSVSAGSTIRRSILVDTIVGENTVVENMILKDSLLGHELTLNARAQVLNLGSASTVEHE